MLSVCPCSHEVTGRASGPCLTRGLLDRGDPHRDRSCVRQRLAPQRPVLDPHVALLGLPSMPSGTPSTPRSMQQEEAAARPRRSVSRERQRPLTSAAGRLSEWVKPSLPWAPPTTPAGRPGHLPPRATQMTIRPPRSPLRADPREPDPMTLRRTPQMFCPSCTGDGWREPPASPPAAGKGSRRDAPAEEAPARRSAAGEGW